jgi:hypothetical protein
LILILTMTNIHPNWRNRWSSQRILFISSMWRAQSSQWKK